MWRYVLVCVAVLGMLLVSQLPVHVPVDRESSAVEEAPRFLGRIPKSPFDMMVLRIMTSGCVPDFGTIPTGWKSIGLDKEMVDEAMRQAFLNEGPPARIKEDCLCKSVEGIVNNLRATISRLGLTLDEIGTSEEKLQLYVDRGRIAEWEYWTELAQYYFRMADEYSEYFILYLQGIDGCLDKAERSLQGEVFEHWRGWQPSWWEHCPP